jgi:hypothetical protein
VTIEEGKDYVAELVGDDKKFKDVQSLARGKLESDNYIKELTSRLDDLRKELDSRTSLDAFLQEMKGLKTPPQNGQVQKDDTPVTPQAVPLDDSTLEQRLDELLERRVRQQKSESNLDQVQRVLKDQLGDQAKNVINNKAKELGMSVKDLEGLATQSPSAFFTLVGISAERQQVTNVPPARSSVNPGPQSPMGVKNKAYFDNLKKTNPSAYWSPQTTVEMIKARKECEARRIPWE